MRGYGPGGRGVQPQRMFVGAAVMMSSASILSDCRVMSQITAS